jgi:hypothetical protein
MNLEVGIILPQLPLFMRLEGCDRIVSIAELTDEQLRQVGKEWTEALVALAKKRRNWKSRIEVKHEPRT